MIFSDKFVCATREYNSYEKHVSNPQFRYSFTLDAVPQNAEITICGLGYYKLYLNGKDITKGFMAPYRSNLNHYLYYDNYNLSQLLQKGENVIGVLLGNGFLNPCIETWDFNKIPYRSAPMVALCVEADGKVLFDATKLKCTESPITFDEFHSGEYYDARLEIDSWQEKGFDDSAWREVLLATAPKGEPRIPDCEPIKAINVRRAQKILKSKKGYIYDFGVNSAGVCKLSISGKRGQEIEISYGEILREGELDNQNISYNEWMHLDRYTLKGDKQEVFVPHFTYHGFRFAEITGITQEQAVPELLEYLEMSSDIEQISDFKCDNASINALLEITMRSNRANFMYFPTDCPQREKNGWTADAALSSEQHLIYLDCARSLKEWLRNIFKAQNEQGAIPGIIPTYDWGFAWGAGPAWDIVMFEIPYRIYQYTGDTEIILEGKEALLKYLKYMQTKRDEKGLMHYGLCDWCHCVLSESQAKEWLCYTDTITCKNLCDKAVALFNAVGDKKSAAYAQNLSDDIKQTIRRELMDEANELKVCNQTTQAMAIYYGIFNQEELSKAYLKLEEIIRKDNNKMSFGVLGNRVIFSVLAESGRIDLALEMMLNPEFPSFEYWLKQGATSLFEGFYHFKHGVDSFKKDDVRIDSLNHHFWGDIIAVFMRHLAGIKVESPTQVKIEPCFTKWVNDVEASQSVKGKKICVKYKKTDETVKMTVTLPSEIDVTLTLPDGYSIKKGEATLKQGENNFVFIKNN